MLSSAARPTREALEGPPPPPRAAFAPRSRSGSLCSVASGAQIVGASRVKPLRLANHGAGTPFLRHARWPSPVLAERPP